MKIASLIHHVGADFEDRKRALQRKEMGEAYKKNAKYVDANKNPMLKAPENLLSGKTEKDLHAADIEAKEQSAQELGGNDKQQQLELLEVKKEIQLLKQTEQNVIAHEQAHKAAGGGVTGAISYSHTTGPDEQRYIVVVRFLLMYRLGLQRMKQSQFWKGQAGRTCTRHNHPHRIYA